MLTGVARGGAVLVNAYKDFVDVVLTTDGAND
jgi:hypothetical protein